MRTDILGVQVDPLSMNEILAVIKEAVAENHCLRVVTANPEMICAAVKDAELKETINSADLVTPDGVGVVWAANYTGFPVAERVTGIDLMERLFPLADDHQWKIFFLGAKPGIAEKAAQKLAPLYPHLSIAWNHGYFSAEEEEAVIRKIREVQPDLLFVGLGAGRQEKWLREHPGLGIVSIGVGGSFDTLAGVSKRAPEWMRKGKVEWLYRLIKEPKRIKRQLVLPVFVFKVWLQKR